MRCHNAGLGSSPFARHYLGNHCLFSLPAGTKMFQFPAFAPCKNRVTALQAAGLSHSEIDGSRDICSYPSLFAAYHVLHRLCEPRHPPCALYYFLAARCLLTCHHNMKPAVTEDVSLLSFFIYSLVLSCANMSKISLHYIRNRFQQYEKPGGRTGRTMLHLTLVTGISS